MLWSENVQFRYDNFRKKKFPQQLNTPAIFPPNDARTSSVCPNSDQCCISLAAEEQESVADRKVVSFSHSMVIGSLDIAELVIVWTLEWYIPQLVYLSILIILVFDSIDHGYCQLWQSLVAQFEQLIHVFLWRSNLSVSIYLLDPCSPSRWTPRNHARLENLSSYPIAFRSSSEKMNRLKNGKDLPGMMITNDYTKAGNITLIKYWDT